MNTFFKGTCSMINKLTNGTTNTEFTITCSKWLDDTDKVIPLYSFYGINNILDIF